MSGFKRLPKHLLLQMDNCGGQNKNRYIFGYMGMLVAKRVFKTVTMGFMMPGHTHDDVDAFFSKFSEALRRQTCYTLPQIMDILKGCVSAEVESTFLTEVPDWKSFIEPHLCSGKDTLIGTREPLQFQIALKDETPVIRYKMRSWHSQWLPAEGIPIFKTLPNGFPDIPSGSPKPMQASTFHVRKDGEKKLTEHLRSLVQYWREGLKVGQVSNYCTVIESVINYWERVIRSLEITPLSSSTLSTPFWPQSVQGSDLKRRRSEEVHQLKEHYFGPRCKRPKPAFDVDVDVVKDSFVLVKPDSDIYPVWLGRCLQNPVIEDGIKHVSVQYYIPIGRRGTEEERYQNWVATKWEVNHNDPVANVPLTCIIHGFSKNKVSRSITIPKGSVDAVL